MRPCSTLCTAALILALAAPGSPAHSTAREGQWTMSWLELEVTLIPEEKDLVVGGVMTLVLEDDAADRLSLGINSRGPTMKFTEVTPSVEARVQLNVGHPRNLSLRTARLDFPSPLSRGDEIEVEFSYTSGGRQSSQFCVDPRVAVASWVEGWYPVPVPPGGKGLTARVASAPGVTLFHLPPGWRALSSGERLDREETDLLVTETWEVDFPVARSFAAGPYQVASHTVGERVVEVYRLGEEPTGAGDQARGLAQALAALEERFGEYPYPSCHLAEVPMNMFTWGASSEQGFVMANSLCFDFGQNLPLFAHESCHGWWGNLVNTTGPGSKMCSEALAQYGAVVAIESLEGTKAAAHFLEYSRLGYVPAQCARGYFEIWRRGQDLVLSRMNSEPSSHNLADSKGNWMYHMLRRRVGDALFFGTLRGLIHKYRGKQMSLADVRRAFLATAPPEARLTRFFEQWLDRTGAPILDVEWDDPGGPAPRTVEFQVLQDGEPYELDLELEVQTTEGSTRHRAWIDGPATGFHLEVTGDIDEVRLDPETRLLLWRPEYGPRPEVEDRGTR